MALSPEEELELLELEEAEHQHQKTKQAEAPKISMGESAVRGATQGATLGFADELGGLAQQGMDKIAGLFGDSVTDVNKKLSDQGFKGDIGPKDSGALYTQARNENRFADDAAQKANPKTYGASSIAGSILPSLAVPFGAGAGVLKTAASAGGMGALQGLGNTEELDSKGAKDALVGAGLGAGTATIGSALAPYLAKGAASVSNKIGNAFGDTAEKLALNATGATGKQVSKFEDDAGRQLLDRGLVKFGDNAENIATRVGAESDRAGQSIGNVLKQLDEGGAMASSDNVVSALENHIKDLAKDPSKVQERAQLQSIIDAITETGDSNIPLSLSEQIKRGFRKKAGNWMDPEAGAAAKKAYLGYMDETERAANAANPELGQLFKNDKETFKLLAPIKEAAEKRAATLNQSPIGGLLDTTAGIGGALIAGPAGGLGSAAASAAARRFIAPRISSSAAVGMDKIGDLLKVSPETFGKFGNVLQSAAQRGSQALGATHFLLQQQNPEYQQLMKNIRDGE
jgi:hypothetical protein